MFEKSLISVDCNRLYDLKERQDPFSCYGRIKANSAGKTLNVTNINTKAGSPNRRTCLHQTAHFLVKATTIWVTPSIFIMFTPPLILLKITNGSLCHRSFLLNTSSLH